MPLLISTAQGGVFTVVSVFGEIDMASEPVLRDALEPLLRRSNPQIVLDLSHVDFCDSTGVSLLVASRRRLGTRGRLLLAGAQPHMERLLQITGLDQLFPMYATVADATATADVLAGGN
jgi:anti-sigma B factor antagonist